MEDKVRPRLGDCLNKVGNIAHVDADTVAEWFRTNSKGKRQKRKLTVTDEVVKLVNESIDDPIYDGAKFVDTVITYKNVLDDLDSSYKVTLEDYINAIRFCSYLEAYRGRIKDAYQAAFAHRDFVKNNRDCPVGSKEYKNIDYAAQRYRKTPLVSKILAQSEIPLYLMYQGYRYAAVETLAEEMRTAKLSKDRISAADRLLVHLKPPEGIDINVKVGSSGTDTRDSIVSTYERAMAQLVEQQRALIMNGGDIKQIANAKIVEADIIEESLSDILDDNQADTEGDLASNIEPDTETRE